VKVRNVIGAMVLCATLPSGVLAMDPPEYQRLRNGIADGTVQVDHVATLGLFKFNVYVDRTTAPMTVLLGYTDESRRALMAVTDPDKFNSLMKRHEKLEVQYQRMIIEGVAPTDIHLEGAAALPAEAKKKT
jgi:hypothetical protein